MAMDQTEWNMSGNQRECGHLGTAETRHSFQDYNGLVVTQEANISKPSPNLNLPLTNGIQTVDNPAGARANGLATSPQNREVASSIARVNDTNCETVPKLVAPPPITIDRDYPGTAVSRMQAVRRRVQQLALKTTHFANGATTTMLTAEDLTITGSWDEIRKNLLKAGGLREIQSGPGDTSFAFIDFHRVDVTAIIEQVWYNEIRETDPQSAMVVVSSDLDPMAPTDVSFSPHTGQKTQGKGQRGDCILLASLYNDDELGPLGFGGGSWVTSSAGCHTLPRIRDEAHARYRSRIAFKLVWVPTSNFDTFVLVDDDGKLLARGIPTFFSHSILGDTSRPTYDERIMNYNMVAGSKYSLEADRIAAILSETELAKSQQSNEAGTAVDTTPSGESCMSNASE